MAFRSPSALSAPENSGDYPLIALIGPTASGKSSLALFLANQLNGEIVNYDSVQVFRGLDIGSGKLPAEKRAGIPHHLLDITVPGRVFTAGDFRRVALGSLAGVKSRGRLPILVGGTGLYLRALLSGLFEAPARSERLRERLRSSACRRGAGFLHRLLARLDPAAASRIHPNDTQKIIRAVEVRLLAGRPISEMHAEGRQSLSAFRVLKIGLNPPRAALYERIDRRAEWMFHSGILDEVRHLLERRGEALRNEPGPLLALGYRQAWAALRGDHEVTSAIQSTQKDTRHYAKRQLTWFRREPDVAWFAGFGDDPRVQQDVLGRLGPLLPARFHAIPEPNLQNAERTIP